MFSLIFLSKPWKSPRWWLSSAAWEPVDKNSIKRLGGSTAIRKSGAQPRPKQKHLANPSTMTTEGEIRIETVEDAVAAEVEWEDWLGCVLVGDCLPRFTDSTMCKSPFKTHHLGHLEAFSRHLFCKSKFIYIYTCYLVGWDCNRRAPCVRWLYSLNDG